MKKLSILLLLLHCVLTPFCSIRAADLRVDVQKEDRRCIIWREKEYYDPEGALVFRLEKGFYECLISNDEEEPFRSIAFHGDRFYLPRQRRNTILKFIQKQNPREERKSRTFRLYGRDDNP